MAIKRIPYSPQPASVGRGVQIRNNAAGQAEQESASSATSCHGKTSQSSKSDDLVRFSVAMPESLLMDFDQLVARRGLAKNRSEVVRELAREALLEWQSTLPGTFVMGTLTIVYDHHSNDLQNRLHLIQHDYFDNIVSTMHVHVDSHLCLEVIVLRGDISEVQAISDMIIGTKGVKNGKLVLATVES